MARSQNDTISERRLRPIYDWLDNGNNKKALQEAEKVLKKQPNFQCCRALKGLALLRLGKEDEALKILDGILTECPVDEGALNAMTLSYRELKMPEKICTLYENATKHEPENEEFLSHLFMSYVRLGNLKKQQTTAMSLYKVKMKNPYYFWSVMSIVLQAVEGDEKLGQAVTLPLAQKMVEKMEKEGKMEQEQETIIYLLILELRNNWKGALDLLNGPLGKKLENSASYHLICLNKRIELEGKLENWSEVARLSRNMLLQQPDSWDIINNYIQAVIKLQEADSTNGGEAKEEGPYSMKLNKVDRSVEEAESLMTCLSAGFPGLRGPFLAKLEICYRTLEGRSNLLQDLIMEYIDLFGGKPVCFSDIKKYLKVIPVEERNNFILRLRSRYPDTTSVPSNTAQIYREICLSGIERFLGQHLNLSTERVDSMVSGLCDRYVASQPLVQHIVTTELRPSDGYLILAGQLLWERWIATKEKRFFLQACSMLQIGLIGSPSNWQLMLLLVRFLGRAGAGQLCDSACGPLDIKNMMLDTLSWVLTRPLAATGYVDKLHRIYCQMTRFYLHSPKETTEHIIQAYKHGNLSQICDMSKLKRRLQTTYLVPNVYTEKILIDLNFLAKSLDEMIEDAEFANLKPIDWKSLADNRDFSTIQSFEPDETSVPDEMIAVNFQLEQAFVRVRRATLSALVTCLKLGGHTEPSGGGDKGAREQALKDLKESEEALSTWLDKSKSLLGEEKVLDMPQAPYRSEMNSLVDGEHLAGVLHCVKLVQTIMITETQEKPGVSGADFEPLMKVLDNLKAATATTTSPDWTVVCDLLESNKHAVESFSFFTIFTFSILSLLRTGKGMKKGKKAVLGAKFSHLESAYKDLTANIQDLGAALHQQLQAIYKTLDDELLSEEMCLLQINETLNPHLQRENKLLLQKMRDSYASQKDQMNTAIESKQKILQSLLL